MSEIHLTPFSPFLASALVKALTPEQYREIDRGMKPPMTMTQQEAVNRASDTNPLPQFVPYDLRSRSRGNQAVPTNMYERIDAMTMNPRSNMPTGQREFELGNRVRGSLSPSNRLIQERNRSPISSISRDVGSAARRGMDRAASSLAPMADAARARFSDVGQSVSEGAQAAGQAVGRAGQAVGRAGQAVGRAGQAVATTASNVASQIPGMADAARQRFNQTGQAIGQGARQLGQTIGQGANQARDAARQRFNQTGQAIGQGARQLGQTIGQGANQARDATNRGVMNVASKIPGMARAAGRMVGTAGRKVGEAAETARERMTSPEAKEFAATTREGAGAMMGAAGRGAMAAGRTIGTVADTSYGVGQDIAGQAMKYGGRGGRALGRGAMNVASRLPGMAVAAGQRLMGLNNPMGRQQQPSGSGGMPFGNNKNSESEAPSGGGANEGYTPSKEIMDNLYQQNIDRSQTRGGIGTGIVSNLLTGGLSGLARGAYNMRQRNIGRQNLQNLNQYGSQAVPFLRSEYETMSDRSIIRSRMTTEAIRNAYVF